MTRRAKSPARTHSQCSQFSAFGTHRLRDPRLSRSRSADFGVRRDRCNSLQDLRSDLVGVALRVRPAVFEIAFVAVVYEAVRYPDRCAAVGHAVAELMDRLGLVL